MQIADLSEKMAGGFQYGCMSNFWTATSLGQLA